MLLTIMIAICVGFNLGGLSFSENSKGGFIFALAICSVGLMVRLA